MKIREYQGINVLSKAASPVPDLPIFRTQNIKKDIRGYSTSCRKIPIKRQQKKATKSRIHCTDTRCVIIHSNGYYFRWKQRQIAIQLHILLLWIICDEIKHRSFRLSINAFSIHILGFNKCVEAWRKF